MNSHFTYLCVKSYNVNGFRRTGTFLWIAENQRSFFKLLSNLVFCIHFLFPYSAEKLFKSIKDTFHLTQLAFLYQWRNKQLC